MLPVSVEGAAAEMELQPMRGNLDLQLRPVGNTDSPRTTAAGTADCGPGAEPVFEGELDGHAFNSAASLKHILIFGH